MTNAAEKFTGKAGDYVRHRPDYPAEYIDYLVASNALTPQSAIADIGAGTGILSRQLLDRGLRVTAIEPNDGMRAAAKATLAGLPGFTAVRASAEATSLPDSSQDLIIAAQAFHWFDQHRFRLECLRALKPAARAALVWNSRQASHPLVRENAAVCREFCPAFNGFSGGKFGEDAAILAFFEPHGLEHREFNLDLVYDLEGFIGRNLSASYAPLADSAACAPFVAALTRLFEKHARSGVAAVPNVTRAWQGRPRA